MTASELHIAFDIELNRLAGYSYDGFSIDEKDWLLNNALEQFLHARLNPKSNRLGENISDTTNRLDELRELLVTKTLPVYEKNARAVYFILPADYFHTSRIDTYVSEDCAGVENVFVDQGQAIIDFPLPHVEVSNWVGYVNDITYFELENISPTTPVNSELTFQLVNRLLEFINAKNDVFKGSCYWENYNGAYYRDSFVLVFNGPTTWAQALNPDPGDDPPSLREVTPKILRKSSFAGDVILSNARVVPGEFLTRQLANPYATTRKDKPVVAADNGQYVVWHNKKFAVKEVEFEYYRKPLRIDYVTNQSIEIGDTVGRKDDIGRQIANAAALIASAKLPLPNFPTLSQQSQLVE